MTDLSFRQGRAEDRAAITAVVYRYAHNAREGVQIEDQLVLFTDDADVILPDGTRLPAARLKEVLRGEEAKYIRHHLTTIEIAWDSETEAHGESSFFAVTNEAVTDHWGCWRDKYVKQSDGAWLIKERAIVVEGADPKGWFSRMYGENS